MEVLRLENLSKYYTSESSVVVGLAGINLSFSTGEFVALTGESGSGKSTLAHVLGGILPYESGELYVYGQPTSHYDAYDWSKYRRDMISFISQSYGILPGNTVMENIESALRLSGLSLEEARERALDILEEVELTEFKKRKAGKLSSGQKQRLSIARALAKPSKILIADEPTGNLDRENSEKVIELLRRAAKDRLVILITHEFEEAKDVATRRIILSDGAVVTDAQLAPKYEVSKEKLEKSAEKEKQKPLVPYVCRLTMKSRPIFSAILCLLLAVTTFITFVFLGNFITAIDDSGTRIYDTDAFLNGSPDRLVVMRSDGESLTEEDYSALMSYKYVESVEKYGYFNDYIYHYKVGVDHDVNDVVVLGPNYDSKGNPDDFTIEPRAVFYEIGYKYLKTLPYTGENIVTSGEAPEGAYEVVSADPDYKVGDTVTVYVRNKNEWSETAYLQIDFTVVGTTDFGEGLYFSDQFAAGLIYPLNPGVVYKPYFPWNIEFIFLPYSPERFTLSPGTPEGFKLGENEFIYPVKSGSERVSVGTEVSLLPIDKERLFLTCAAQYDATLTNLALVSEETYANIAHCESNQASIYIKDYAYAERVMDAMTADDYITVSPFKMGATMVNTKLANERLITLAICAATFLIAFVLQCILLRAMFSSLFEYYKLMSNTGLTAKIAYGAVIMLLVLTTLIGEAIGAGVIFALNGAQVARVVNIFKYLDTATIAILFALHFFTVALSLSGILVSLKKIVFGKGKSSYDIDFTLMEDDAQ